VTLMLAGCAGPRVVFLPAADAPVRAGPDMSGRVYVWRMCATSFLYPET